MSIRLNLGADLVQVGKSQHDPFYRVPDCIGQYDCLDEITYGLVGGYCVDDAVCDPTFPNLGCEVGRFHYRRQFKRSYSAPWSTRIMSLW